MSYLIPPLIRGRLRTAGVRHLHGTGPIPGGPGLVQPPILAPFDTVQDSSAVSCEDNPTIASSRPDLPPWIYPPTNWENIDQDNYALVPAIGSTVIIISYVVPPGRNGVIKAVANNFVGGGWVEGTGDIIWRILVDGTPPPGATSYDSILASLGNPASPTGIAGFRIFENQVLTLVAFNNPAGPNGGVVVAGQRVGARFVGWNYPTDIEESDIWI
jgi:hypothetical protein